jgi:hypothetical protein
MAAPEPDVIAFYRFLLRTGDRHFAARVAGLLKRDPTLSERVSSELRMLPRTPGTSPAAIRALGSLTARLGLESA